MVALNTRHVLRFTTHAVVRCQQRGLTGDAVEFVVAHGQEYHAGDGSKNPYKSPLINGFDLSPAEKADVIAFLESLTDQELLTDPRLSDPWK